MTAPTDITGLVVDLRSGNIRLRIDSHRLRRAISRLKDDRRAIEHVARDELGLVRPGDIVFQFDTAPRSSRIISKLKRKRRRRARSGSKRR